MPGLFNWDSGQSSPAPGGIGPGTLPNGTVRYQVIVTGASPFAPEYSTFLLDGIAGGKTHLNVNNGVSLELRADDKDNTGLGRNMLMNISTGQLNVAIGADALLYVQSGYGNVAVGVQTLEDLWTSIGTTGYNTAIGTNTARGINTGENNTIIGARVTGLGTALSNTVILADGAGLIRFQSNPTLTGKIIGAITAGKSLTLTATDDYNVTFAGTGTVSLSGHTHAGMGDISGTGIVGRVAEFVTNTKTLQAANLIAPTSNILTITNDHASTLGLDIVAGKTLTLKTDDDLSIIGYGGMSSVTFSDDGESFRTLIMSSPYGDDSMFLFNYGSGISVIGLGTIQFNGNYTLYIPATGTAALLGANIFTAEQRIVADSFRIWKDAGASAAVAYGMGVPGAGITNDAVISTYNSAGGGWIQRLTIQSILNGGAGINIVAPAAKWHVYMPDTTMPALLIGNTTTAWSATHAVEIIAPAGADPLMLSGGYGNIVYWKDSTPTMALAFGMAKPGDAAGEHFKLSTYLPGTGWVERMCILASDGSVKIPSLAGILSRPVMAAADGTLSAP